ncbi:MAG: adaptor protein MecA [Lachnospiraceae bacterium]|nr:adaptor protein MecA [Lachnospiraceae bacterium]
MVFKRIDENTVKCFITQEDLQESGIRIDDLLMQKKESIQNLRDAVQRAAVQENFTLDGHYTTMQLAVLRDNSVSLTLSQENPIPSSLLAQAGRDLFDAVKANWTGENTEKTPSRGLPDTAYFFHDMSEVIRAAARIHPVDAAHVASSLYKDPKTGRYFLLISGKPGAGEAGFVHITLVMNEFAKETRSGSQEIAYMKEHGDCILQDNALADLQKL